MPFGLEDIAARVHTASLIITDARIATALPKSAAATGNRYGPPLGCISFTCHTPSAKTFHTPIDFDEDTC